MTFQNHPRATATIGIEELKLSDGDLTLDSGRYPYAEASVTVPMPDAEVLEDIEPGQRVSIKASSNGTWEKVYTPWVEQHRNLIPTPAPNAYAGSGWATSAAAFNGDMTDEWVGVNHSAVVTAYFFTDGVPETFAIGDQVTLTVQYRVNATAGAATHVRVSPHIRTGNVYIQTTGQLVWRPIVVGQIETVQIQWTVDRAIAANDLDIALGSAGASGAFTSVAAGWSMQVRRPTIERGHVEGEPFTGDTPDEEFLQYRWLGTANASASVIETRALDHMQWNPDAGITADLHLVKREASHDNKELTLRLASDEAILERWAPLEDDSTPRTHEADLRALTNYVLNKAIPGASLEAGTANADLTARWDAQNMLLNPEGWHLGAAYTNSGSSTISYNTTAGQGVGGTTGFVNGTSTAATTCFIGIPQAVSARKGQMFTLSGYAHRSNGQPALDGRFRVYEMDSSGTILRQIESTPVTIPEAGSVVPGVGYNFLRYSLTFTVENPNTTKLAMYFRYDAAASGRAVGIDQLMLTEGPVLLPYFSGTTAPAGYVTNWTGQSGPVNDNSVSERRPADGIERLPELFTWRAGDSAWKFLEPLVTSAGYRLFCDEQRNWYLIDPVNYSVPGRFSARPDNTVEGTDTMDADDEETGITGVVARFKWTSEAGEGLSRNEFAGVPGKVKVLEFDRPFSAGVAAAHLGKVQGQNRTQDVTCAVDYSVRPGQEIQIDLPGTNPQLGTLTSSRFELTNGLMGLTSAGLRDTPPGAIDLLSGSIDSLSGTIDSLT